MSVVTHGHKGWLEEGLEPECRGRSLGARGGQSRRKKRARVPGKSPQQGLTGGRKLSTSDPDLLDEKILVKVKSCSR